MSTPTIDQFPIFLQSYGNLVDHLNSQLDDLTSKGKGDIFARFTSKIIPLTEVGLKSEFDADDIKIRQHSHDEGVDIECINNDRSRILYVQSKLTLRNASEFDTIISKFENYQRKFHPDSQIFQPLLLEGTNEVRTVKAPEVSFMIVTLSNMERILPIYESSNFSSKRFYSQLKSRGQIYVLDGLAILPILQSAYRKLHILPTDVELHLSQPTLRQDNVYIGIISAQELKECYKRFGDALFLGNIRDFLGFTSGKKKIYASRENVNEKILETAEQEPDKMLARNNGITFRAKHVQMIDGQTLLLDEASIVNGCQTTMCLIQSPKPEAFVLVKIVEASDSWDIAKAANFQNRVEQIELELAQYIRPQEVKTIGNKAGIHIEQDNIYTSIFDVFDSIYQDQVAYEEIYYLFIGLFSRTINNVVSANYTELRSDLLGALETQELESEETFNTLFKLYKVAQDGRVVAERTYKDGSYRNIFQRFWRENKPNYRSLLTILAACGCTNTNIYDKSVNFKHFLRDLSTIIDGDKDKFVRYYQYAFEATAHRLMSSGKDENETLRTMYDGLRGASFDNLYKQLRLIADRCEPHNE